MKNRRAPSAPRFLLALSLGLALASASGCIQANPFHSAKASPNQEGRTPATTTDEPAPQQPPKAADIPKINSPYCEMKEGGQFQVKDRPLPAQLTTAIQQWTTNAQIVGTSVDQMREDLLTNPNAFGRVAGVLQSTDRPAMELKESLVPILAQIPAAYRLSAQVLLEAYFQIAAMRLELELMQDPWMGTSQDPQTKTAKAWSMSELRAKYTLTLPTTLEQTLFAHGTYSLPGVTLDANGKDGQTTYTLSPSPESVFRAMVRVAARSPKVGGLHRSYVETVRCILGRAILGKYALNKVILDKGDLGQPLPAEQNFCLGARAADFIDFVRQDTNFTREMILRSVFLKNIPNFIDNLPEDTSKFMAKWGLYINLTYLAAFPEEISAINANRKTAGKEMVPSADYKAAFDHLQSTIEAEYQKASGLQALRSVWTRPNIQSQLALILQGCGVTLVNRDGNPLSVNDVVDSLKHSDDIFFLSNLYGDISAVPGRWTDLNHAQLTTALRDYIVAKKLEGSMHAIRDLVIYYGGPKAARVDELLQVTYDDLRAALSTEFNQMWNAHPETQKWLEDVVTKIESERGNAESYNQLLTAFTEELVKGAEKVAKVVDPKRDASTLQYNEKAVLDVLSPTIGRLTGNNPSRFALLYNESDSTTRNKLWGQIRGMLESETKANGGTCNNDAQVKGIWDWAVGGLFKSQSNIDRRATSQDCYLFTMLAGAIGADGTTTPNDMKHTLDVLKATLGDSKTNEFIEEYRKRLASLLTADNRLLDLPIKENGDDRLWKKMVHVKETKALEPDVITGLKQSVGNLLGYLNTVTHATKKEDLEFFIKRTTVINTLLGEGEIDINRALDRLKPNGERVSTVLSGGDVGFIFPNLVEYHRDLQRRTRTAEDVKNILWEEFVQTNVNLGFIIVGGWAGKVALGVFPRFTGRAAARGFMASTLDRSGGRISSYINGQFDYTMLVFAGAAGRSILVEKRDADLESYRVSQLGLSEGVALMKKSTPFPLLSEDDYFHQAQYYEKASHEALVSAERNIALTTLPFFLGHGFQWIEASVMSGRRFLATHGRFGQALNQFTLRSSFNARRMYVTRDLRILGNPELDVGSLQAARTSKWQAAKTDHQRFIVDEAYNRIITAFGRDARAYAEYPEMQEAFAQALFGNRGSLQQLKDLNDEYLRVTNGGLE